MTAALIREHGLLSDTLLARAMPLLEETGGDGTLLVQRIREIEGIGAGKQDDLREGLTRLECLVDTGSLSAVDAVRRLRQEFPAWMSEADTVFERLQLCWQ